MLVLVAARRRRVAGPVPLRRRPRSAQRPGRGRQHRRPGARSRRRRSCAASWPAEPVSRSRSPTATAGSARWTRPPPASTSTTPPRSSRRVAATAGRPSGSGRSSPGAATTTPWSPSTSRRCRRPSTRSAQGIAQPPVNGSIAFHDGRAVGVPGRPGPGRPPLRRARAADPPLPARRVAEAADPGPAAGGDRRRGQPGPRDVRPAGDVRPGDDRARRPAHRGAAAACSAGRSRCGCRTATWCRRSTPTVLMEALAPVTTTVRAEPEDARIELRDGKPVVVPARVGVTADPDALETWLRAGAVRHGAARRVVVPGPRAAALVHHRRRPEARRAPAGEHLHDVRSPTPTTATSTSPAPRRWSTAPCCTPARPSA